MPARGREIGVPRDLAIVVGVDVDKAGCHDQAGRFDFARRSAELAANCGDDTTRDPDITGVAIMLASPAGAFITGQIIPVDGGTTLV